MSKWLNTKKLVWKHNDLDFPCSQLKYCPYGQLVEEFPLTKDRSRISCPMFGHHCPAYYLAEDIDDHIKHRRKLKVDKESFVR